MGTRSTVKFYEQGECIASIYQQYDGYPSCVGLKLAEFLKSKTVINGISGQTMESLANGIGCLSAQYIAKIKDRIGNVYMTSASDLEEYNYIVHCNECGVITVKVEDFAGNVDEFLRYCKQDE
jgi:hypothetical protein